MAVIRGYAAELTKGLPVKDKKMEADRVNRWVRENVRYVGDINGVETLHYPVTTLQTRAGDCDDMAMLNAALLMALGHDCVFVALNQGRGYAHVWTRTKIGSNQWLDLEPTENYPTGVSVPILPGNKLLICPI